MTNSAYANIILDRHGDVAVLTLNRPQVRNAVNDTMREELLRALQTVRSDEAVRALVLTGAGTAFCAGGDIAAMRERLEWPEGYRAYGTWLRQTRAMDSLEAIMSVDKPVVAVLNGAAAGVGCDMALACDVILASTEASLSFSYLARGLVPDGALYFLPRRVGLSKAKTLIYTGQRIDAAKALGMGLVDRLASAHEALEEGIVWARSLGESSGPAFALSKSILNQSLDSNAPQIFDLARHAQAICATSQAHRDAVKAFLNKGR